MSEPRTRAGAMAEILPGILHWTLHDDRLDFRSDAWALRTPEGHVLVDPLPLEEELLDRLAPVQAICLTGGFHQRSAWRYQERFGAPVWCPADATDLEGEPDHAYRDGEALPGGLQARHAPGPSRQHYVLHLSRPDGVVVFGADLLCEAPDGALVFAPARYMEDPEATRATVRSLLELDPAAWLPAHGGPVPAPVRAALERALAENRELGA